MTQTIADFFRLNMPEIACRRLDECWFEPESRGLRLNQDRPASASVNMIEKPGD